MRTLSRYLVARFVQLFLVVVVVAVLSISVIELLLNLDRMIEFGGGLGGSFDFLWLRLASEYASYIVPLAAFLAAFSTAALSAYAREWLALRAGGIGLAGFALPLLACGAATAFAAVMLHELVVVEARQEWSRRRDGDANIRFQEGSFWYQRGTRIYRVAEADRDSRTLREVRVFERDERGRLLRTIAAERIEILDARRWRFLDAVFRELALDEPDTAPTSEQAEQRIVEIADPRDRALMGASPDSLSTRRLFEFIRAKEARGESAVAQWGLLYGRFSDWASVALLVALAVPLGLGVERTRSLAWSAAQATAALAAFYTVRNVGAVLSAQGVLPPGVAALVVAGTLAALAGLAAIRTPR